MSLFMKPNMGDSIITEEIEQWRKEVLFYRPQITDLAKEMMERYDGNTAVVRKQLDEYTWPELIPTADLSMAIREAFTDGASFSVREEIEFELADKGVWPHPPKYNGVVVPYGVLSKTLDTIGGIINNTGKQ